MEKSEKKRCKEWQKNPQNGPLKKIEQFKAKAINCESKHDTVDYVTTFDMHAWCLWMS